MSDQPSKLDMFEVLKHIDKKDRNYLSQLPVHLQKQFTPFMVMLWLSNANNNPTQTILVNEVVNKYIFSLHKHPKLLYLLMIQCTTGNIQRYSWCKLVKKKTTTKSHQLLQRAFQFTDNEAKQALQVVDQDQLIQLALAVGVQPDEVKDLIKEFKVIDE